MRRANCSQYVVAACLVLLVACSGEQKESSQNKDIELRFSITEGRSENYFIRERGVSGHLNLQTRPAPRLVIAFPAGNSGAALFFGAQESERVWGPVDNLQAIEREDGHGRTLYGVRADITVAVDHLALDEVDVGSVRFLRKAVNYAALPPRGDPKITIAGNMLQVSRERPDGEASYLLQVELLAGDLNTKQGIRFQADTEGQLKIRVAAASGDPLESPVAAEQLLTDRAGDQPALRQALAFLTYETKMLAGSWRFLTYFGRDTLLSLRLLMPVLTAEAAEIGLRSVLERINGEGEVAHEEEIGELAVYRNLAERNTATAAPIFDYDMVDDNLLLAPVLMSYIETFGIERANEFLSGNTSDSVPLRARLLANLELIVRQARAFAEEPTPENLVPIKTGLSDGNWRDSEEGLVGGRFPYDVNAVLMPAALYAAAGIVGNDLPGISAGSLPGPQALRQMAAVWEQEASGHFEVSISAEQASAQLAAYARDNGYPVVDIPAAGVHFHAVALDERFAPIPVMHSDIGADLLLLEPAEQRLAHIVASLTRPFPAGLSTPVGILSANPAFAAPDQQALVTRNHYHGTVVWSWQQAMIVAGLDAQLRRDDLPDGLRQKLQTARQATWGAIEASEQVINSELWSFTMHRDEFAIAPFGQSEGHLTESNAAQLWSTVFLALRPEVIKR